MLAHRRIDGDCWVWTGLLDQGGYGVTRCDGKRWKVHRLAYLVWVGDLPDGPLDHVRDRGCTTPACFNPAHLEPVTTRENNRRSDSPWAVNARKTHCVHGHEYTPENTRYEGGRRACRTCRNDKQRDKYHATHPDAAYYHAV